VLMGLGKLFRIDLKTLLLSSNANIGKQSLKVIRCVFVEYFIKDLYFIHPGGPTTAAAMAQAKGENHFSKDR